MREREGGGPLYGLHINGISDASPMSCEPGFMELSPGRMFRVFATFELLLVSTVLMSRYSRFLARYSLFFTLSLHRLLPCPLALELAFVHLPIISSSFQAA